MTSISTPRIVSAAQAMLHVGGKENFLRLKHAGWIAPLKGKNRGMDYDIRDIDVALDRVKLDGWPEAPPRKKGES